MPEKDFQIIIDAETVIRVYLHTHRGRLVGFSVVLIVLHRGEWIDVGRFDSAHGIPHQDVLGKKAGLRDKVWYDNLTPKEVFALAISTFRQHHEQIKKDYLRS